MRRGAAESGGNAARGRLAAAGGICHVEDFNAAAGRRDDDFRMDVSAVSVTGRLAFALEPVAVMVQVPVGMGT